MKKVSISIPAALLLASCGGDAQGDGDANNRAQPLNPAFETQAGPKPAPSPTRFPLPAAQPSGMVNPEAPPEVARHIARQERCAHWRDEQEGGAVRPEVSQGLARECEGIDAELSALRARYDMDGAAASLLRPFGTVGR